MKKYNYLNQSQKILLAAMAIPVVIYSLPIENVSANTTIPLLKAYELNGEVKLEWAVDMPSENILSVINYEQGPDAFNLNMGNQYDYLQTISSEGAFSGNYGYLLNDNSNNKGNFYAPSSMHYLAYDRFYFPNGTNLSMTFKAKSVGTSSIEPAGDGGWAKSLVNLEHKAVKNHVIGETKLQLDSVDHLYVGYYITTDTNPNVINQMLYITDIDTVNKTITLNSGINRAITAGSNIVNRPWRPAYNFPTRTLSNTDWETVSINTQVYNFDDYNVATNGASFYIVNRTDGKLLIDDIKFGYATEVEVFRDGTSIYKGFLSDFQDKSVKDNSKPNAVLNLNTEIDSNFNVKFAFDKPGDNGNTYNYQMQSISKTGVKSPLSSVETVTLKSGVKSYKYSVSKSAQDVPETSFTTNSIDIPLKSLNLEEDYIHIQAIDAKGNESKVTSFKVKDILNVNELQNAYDKIKELETSNSYEDFIDFIDEIESLYGDNLPQDLKELIDKLGKHHGVNTSFLLLEEGDFRLTTADIHDFGTVKLTAKKQTIKSDFMNSFNVIDARGTQEGWNVSVSATPFTVETFDGFVGTPHELPLGSLALNNVTGVEQIGQVHNSQLPDITLNQLTAIDGENQTVNLLNAGKQKGMGEFKFSFGQDALALTVDAVTAKIDNVNYPDQNTPYASTVTWNLVSGPQI